MAFRYFGGIDFSGAREPLSNLWSAVGEERGGKLHVLALCPHPFRADLAAHVAGGWRKMVDAGENDAILWGADFPFGLPAGAARRLVGPHARWEDVLAWVADRPADEVRDAVPDLHKTGRRTDTGGALAPLDLRLYKQTVEGLRWIQALRDEAPLAVHPQAPGADPVNTALIEVYPVGAVRDLGIKGGKVPSRPGEVRARPAALRAFLTFDHPCLEAAAVTLEDARDACIACLTAWLCRDDLRQPHRLAPAPEAAALTALEGWIYRPPAALP